MKIKSMTATFGKLENAHLEFGAGLNLIHAPNEGGKSTWAAFWKTMLFGLDTRDRDKKGYLADKNRYQPWSGAPMMGEVTLEWQGRDITIRRGPKGNTPFGAFSAVYTGTEEPVPGLTADTCGPILTGVGREVFERSAFIGSGGSLSVTAAPELEARIAALVSSGQEDVSFSQTQSRLKEWLNRRRVNRSVGLIPKLEGELAQVDESLAQLTEAAADIARLEGERAALDRALADLTAEQATHRRLAQRDLNRRYAQAGEELNAARAQLAALEQELSKFGPLPDPAAVRHAQGELEYLKVLDGEIKQGEAALAEAEEAYVQAQIAVQDEHFQGLSGEEAGQAVAAAQSEWQTCTTGAEKKKRGGTILLINSLLAPAVLFLASYSLLHGTMLPTLTVCGAFLVGGLLFSLLQFRAARALRAQAEQILARYHVGDAQQLQTLLLDYQARCTAADGAAAHAKTVRGALNDRKARRENTHADLMSFVHSFAPEASGLFGCSAALSRALSLDHERAMARERVAERLRRREDLAAQGGQDVDTLELLHTPERAPEETDRLHGAAVAQLDQVNGALNRALGRQKAMGDPAALAARREQLEGELARRRQEQEAISLAMDALQEANARLQERFSPELNRLTGAYMARLTGGRYEAVTFNRELEGMAARPGDVLPHSALFLSRGTADQLYLALRLAVCALCLPQKPPVLLDDALAAFDDGRMALALDLLGELAREQQVLLFTCQRREGDALAGQPNVTHLAL